MVPSWAPEALLGTLVLVVPILTLLVYRWGFAHGHTMGRAEVAAYKLGQKQDGGCWVKAQHDSLPPPPP